MKRIAFSTLGRDFAAPIDPRFGRAARFLIYDLGHNSIQLIDNQQGRNDVQGAGIPAAEIVVQAGADTLVTGHCGPKAFNVLNAAGVAIYSCDPMTVEDALNGLLSGSLTAASSSDIEGLG